MFAKSRIPWNKGKKRPPFSAEWIEKMRIARRRRGGSPFAGHKHSDESKAKTRATLLAMSTPELNAKKAHKGERHWHWTGRIIRKCLGCGEDMSIAPTDKRKTCSYKCAGKVHRKWMEQNPIGNHRPARPKANCQGCGKTLSKPDGTLCRKCWGISVRGSNNHQWRGGGENRRRSSLQSWEYKEWRDAVFKRDNYTCQCCGQHGYRLQADHIKEYAKYPDLRYDVSNGRTLCVRCHQVRHYTGKNFAQHVLKLFSEMNQEHGLRLPNKLVCATRKPGKIVVIYHDHVEYRAPTEEELEIIKNNPIERKNMKLNWKVFESCLNLYNALKGVK